MAVQKCDLDTMSVDELWSLHEEISAILSVRILDQKRELEKRLSLLNLVSTGQEPPVVAAPPEEDHKARRKYPKVWPRYRNPETSETWSGRGKQPRWLFAAMEAGRSIEEFRIDR